MSADAVQPPPMPPTLKRWRVNVFAATWMSYAGYYFCRKAFGIVKKPLGEQLELSDLELAHIWTAFLLAYMVGQFLAAFLGRRVACRRLLLTGMGISLLANFAFGVLMLGDKSGYSLMICFMVVNGFAQATGWPGNVGLLAKWTVHRERGTLMGVWATCYQLGSILAKLFAAFMFSWLGLAWSFWGASIILLIVWLIFYKLGQEQPENVGLPAMSLFEVVDVDSSTDEKAEQVQRSDRAVWLLIIGMGLCYFCFKFVRYALDSWAPMLIEETFDQSTGMAGTASTVFDWIGFLGVFVAGVASDKLFKAKRAPVIFFMTVGMMLATIAIGSIGMSSFVWFVVLLGLIGFMLMGPDSLLSGTAAMDVGSARMAVVAAGIINGLGSIGPVVQEELIGYLKTNSGMDAVFQLLIGVTVLAVIGTGLLWAATSRMKNSL